MANPESFRLKTHEQLIGQVRDISTILGESILPPSAAQDEVLTFSLDFLMERFPERYRMYVDTLGRKRVGGDPNPSLTRRLHTLNALDRYVTVHYTDESTRTLMDRQMTVFEDSLDFLEAGGREGYIKLPTGAGKTILFIEFAEATDLRTLIVVPTKLLVDQTERKFKKFAPDVEIGKVYEDSKDYERQVTITTYSSFLTDTKNGRVNPDDYELLILDEVHKSLTLKRSAAVKRFGNAIKLGFTATPRYSKERHVGNLLDTEIHSMTIKEAVEEEMLSSLSVYIAKTDIDLSKVRVTHLGNYNDEDLDRAVNIASRNIAAVELYKNMFMGQSGVSYCVSVAHAQNLARLFNENRIPAAVVSGYQTKDEQQDVLAKFQTGEIKMVCNADILIEGFDEPQATICLNLRPTTSPVIAEQRAGRVLRPDPDNPYKYAYIVDFIDQFTDSDHFPVSFAQILETAHVLRKNDTPSDANRDNIYDRGIVHYPQIAIAGLTVITEAEEVIRLVREMEDQKYHTPDEGWMSKEAIRRRFKIERRTIFNLINPFRETNPQYFRIYKGEVGGKVSEHFAPELVEYIRNMKANWQAPVEGWVDVYRIALELRVNTDTVEQKLAEYRQKNPSTFRLFRMRNGHFKEHFAPEIAEAVKSQLLSARAPEDWISIPNLAKLLNVTTQTANRFVQTHKVLNPEVFKTFIHPSNGQPGEYVHSSIVEKLIQERANIPVAEEGWMSVGALAADLDAGQPVIDEIVNRYRETNPEYFQVLKIKANGNIAEHFSPELVVLIRQERSTWTTPEEGWVNYRDLAKELGYKNESSVRDAVKIYLSTYPQHFRFYAGIGISRRGRSAQFVSPTLVALIKEERQKMPDYEEGWVTRQSLIRIVKRRVEKIKEFVDMLRADHPDYFRLMRDRSRVIREHYSPEAVALIRATFQPSGQ